MSVRVNVPMPKIMRTSIKVAVRTDATYANCRTLPGKFEMVKTYYKHISFSFISISESVMLLASLYCNSFFL